MRANIKKMIALLLSAAMVLGMNTTAFAEEIIVEDEIILTEDAETTDEIDIVEESIEEEIPEEELVLTDELAGDPEGTPIEELIENEALRTYLIEQEKLDKDTDGYITEEEIANYTAFSVEREIGSTLTDLSDLEKLTGLVSIAIISELNYKDKITEIKFPAGLKSLYMQDTQMHKLDISGITDLEYLEIPNCKVDDDRNIPNRGEGDRIIYGLDTLKKLKYINLNNSDVSELVLSSEGSGLLRLNCEARHVNKVDLGGYTLTGDVKFGGDSWISKLNINYEWSDVQVDGEYPVIDIHDLHNLKDVDFTLDLKNNDNKIIINAGGDIERVENLSIERKDNLGQICMMLPYNSAFYLQIEDTYPSYEIEPIYNKPVEIKLYQEKHATYMTEDVYRSPYVAMRDEGKAYTYPGYDIKIVHGDDDWTASQVDPSEAEFMPYDEYDPNSNQKYYYKFHKAGTYKMIATTSYNPDIHAEYTFKVMNRVTGIDLDPDTVTLNHGTSQSITAKLTPSDSINPEVYWDVTYLNSENETVRLATPDGLSIKKTTDSAKGTAKATLTAASKIRPGEYTITAHPTSNYQEPYPGSFEEWMAWKENRTLYIDTATLTIPAYYTVSSDKATIYYQSASDAVAKITVSNAYDVNTISAEIVDAAQYNGIIKLEPDPSAKNKFKLMYTDSETDKTVKDTIEALADREVTIKISADGETKTKTIGLDYFEASGVFGTANKNYLFNENSEFEYTIDSAEESAEKRHVEITAKGNKGAVTITCDNPNVGTFAYNKTTKTATLDVVKNIENSAIITLKADGIEKKVLLNIKKTERKNVISGFNHNINAVVSVVEGDKTVDSSVFSQKVHSDLNDGRPLYPVLPKMSVKVQDDAVNISNVSSSYTVEDGAPLMKYTVTPKDAEAIILGVTDEIIVYFEAATVEGNKWSFDVLNIEQNTETIEFLKKEVAVPTRTEEREGTEYGIWEERIPVTFSGKITDDQIQALQKQALVVEDGVAAYAIINDKKNYTLGDVELLQGGTSKWSFVNPNEVIKADNARPIQYFEVKYDPAGTAYEGFDDIYATLPVAVTQITGVTLQTSKPTLVKGDFGYVSAYYKCTGYNDIWDTLFTTAITESLDYSWTHSDKSGSLTISDSASKQFCQIESSYEGAKDNKVNVTLTATDKQGKKMTAKCPVTLVNKVIEEIEVGSRLDESDINYYSAGHLISTDLNKIAELLTTKESTTVSLKMLVDGEVAPGLVKWSSSNTSVASVKENKDGSVDITLKKKAGTAVIKGEAKDAGKKTIEFKVEISDFTPVILTKKITLNKYASPSSVVVLSPQDGNKITSAWFADGDNMVDFSPLIITDVNADGQCYIDVDQGADDSEINNINVKTTLKVDTEKGRTYTYPIQITGSTATPKVSMTQGTKARIFELDNTDDMNFTFKLKSKAKITDLEVADESKCGTGTFGIEKVSYDPETMTATLGYRNVTQAITKEMLEKPIKLKVTFDGYTGEYIVSTPKVKYTTGPAVAVADVKIEFLKSEPADKSFEFKLKDKNGNDFYSISDPGDITLDAASKKAGFSDDVIYNGLNKFVIKYSGIKNAKFTFKVNDHKLYSPVTIKGSVSAIAIKELAISNAKPTFSVNDNGNSEISTVLKVKNDEFAQIEKVYYGTDKKGKEILDSGYFRFSFDRSTGKFYIKKNEGVQAPKAGTYKLNVKGQIRMGAALVDTKIATISLVVSDKAPTVSVSAKGTKFTTKLANSTSPITGFELDTVSKALFTAVYNEGVIEVTPKGSLYKKEYKLGGAFTLEDGTVINWDGKSKGQYLSVKVK